MFSSYRLKGYEAFYPNFLSGILLRLEIRRDVKRALFIGKSGDAGKRNTLVRNQRRDPNARTAGRSRGSTGGERAALRARSRSRPPPSSFELQQVEFAS